MAFQWISITGENSLAGPLLESLLSAFMQAADIADAHADYWIKIPAK